MKLTACCLAIILMAAAPGTAQTGVTGTWRVEGDGLPFPWEVAFREDGAKLAGLTTTCSSNGPREIFDAAITRTSITFKCSNGSGVRTITFAGELGEDEIVFTWSFQVKEGERRDPRPDGLFGSSAPARFTVKRVPDGELARTLADRLGAVNGMEFVGAVNLLSQDVRAEGAIFVPNTVRRVKAILVVDDYGLGWDLSASTEWRKLADATQAALLGVRFSRISINAGAVNTDNQDAKRDALMALLGRLARETGHEELGTAPMLFWGHSAAATAATRFAGQLPDRTLAFVRYHIGAGPNEDITVVSRIPALILTGGKEANAFNVPNSEAFWKRARAAGAPWTFAVEPNATHGDVNDARKANELVLPWITAVIRERLSPDGGALRPLTDRTGWMGNNQTAEIAPVATFKGPQAQSSWLPDEASARAWQNVIRGGG